MTEGFSSLALWALVAVLCLGAAAAGWWAAHSGALALADAAAERVRGEAAVELATLRERLRRAEAERVELQAQELPRLRAQAEELREALELAREDRAELGERSAAQIAGLRAQVAGLDARLEAERAQSQEQLAQEQRQSQEKLALLAEARDALGHQFKSLANDILEEKSRRFAEQNQASLGQLLDPLRTRLADFQGKVEQFYDSEGRQRAALAQQVTQLMDLNRVLSDEARNLTQALKGSSKAQGNWGELILERVLEASGLRRGFEYHVQQSHLDDAGRRAIPDVVIHLPQERKMVVDAKVSLLAYEECVRSETDALRGAAQRRHLASIRSHIEGLSGKNYQRLYTLKSLDFVLMFVPIEPAFMLAVAADDQLFMDAWQKNVLLVSPSTLLFVVRTVAHLWRQEAQSRNAQDIARRGAELYDKLAAFVADLEKVGRALDTAQGCWRDAYGKFKDGKGNAIRQAEMLRNLGVKPTKSFSPAARAGALPEDDAEDEGGERGVGGDEAPAPDAAMARAQAPRRVQSL